MQELQVHLVQQVPWGLQGRLVVVVVKVQQVLLEVQEQQVPPAKLGRMEELELQDCPANQELLELLGHQVFQVQQETLELRDLLDRLGQLDYQVLLGAQVHLVLVVVQEH